MEEDGLRASVIDYAKDLWAHAKCPKDFCIQVDDGDRFVFGGTNRVRWFPRRGFQIDASYCTECFIAAYDDWLSR